MVFLDVILWEGKDLKGTTDSHNKSQQSLYSSRKTHGKCFQLLSTFADRFVTFLLQSVVVAANHFTRKLH